MTASTCSGGPAITVCCGAAYTATVMSGYSPDQLLGLGGAQLQQRHRALTGQPRHQLRPRRNDFQTVGRAQRTRHHRRGHLAHRMADHRIRLNPVGPPQRRQRQLHTHQHRLDTFDTDDRLTGEQRVAQRKTHLRNEIRLQLGHRRGKRRLVGQQLPTHTRPLRTLTRIQEHGARCHAEHRARRRLRASVSRRPAPADRPRPRCGRARTPWRFCCADCGTG